MQSHILNPKNDLVSTNNKAQLKITTKDANCSEMEVDFQRIHDTKNGFALA